MEAAIANLLEPGEKIIVGVNGIWGERVADLSERYQGEQVYSRQGAACGHGSPALKCSSSGSSSKRVADLAERYQGEAADYALVC